MLSRVRVLIQGIVRGRRVFSRAYNMEHSIIFCRDYLNYVIHWIDEITPDAMRAMG